MVGVAAPPPGKPHGKIDVYDFPESAVVNEDKEWALSIHNDGDISGVIFGGIANLDGNPGDIIIIWQGSERRVPPGYFWYFYGTRDVCQYAATSGKVRFTAKGKYTIRLLGGHIIDGTKYIDDQIDIDG